MSLFIAQLRKRVLAEVTHGLHPLYAPPTSRTVVEATEAQLGFQLPDLLKALYLEIGNGGFGPGDVINTLIGLPGGALYNHAMSLGDLYISLTTPAPDDPLWIWPPQLLVFLDCGCGIFLGVDCAKSGAPLYVYDTNIFPWHEPFTPVFLPFKPSLEHWLHDWLVDVDMDHELWQVPRPRIPMRSPPLVHDASEY